MLRAHKIRLNPTPEQEAYFLRAAGCARFTYNWALARYKELKAEGQTVDWNALKMEFRRQIDWEFPFIREVTKCAPEQAIADLRQAQRVLHRQESQAQSEDSIPWLAQAVKANWRVRVGQRQVQSQRPPGVHPEAGRSQLGRSIAIEREDHLAYKTALFWGLLQKVDRFFPSSQRCHVCGSINGDLELSDREWVCLQCGTWHDRDFNASKNLELEGVCLLASSGFVGATAVELAATALSFGSEQAGATKQQEKGDHF
jgi:transposase